MMKPLLFSFLWLFTAAVSAFDAFLLIRHSVGLVEQNPIARRLIQAGGIELAVAVKMFGTTVALAILLLVYQRCRTAVSMSVATGLALLQFILLLYLVLT